MLLRRVEVCPETPRAMFLFDAVVSAFTYSILSDRCGWRPDPQRPLPHNQVVRFIREQHARMPRHLALPLALLAVVADWSVWPRYRAPFHALPAEQRRTVVNQWRHSELGPLRDLVKFFESLAIFGAFAERYEGPGPSVP